MTGTEWMRDAKCAGHDADLWFPNIGELATEAKAICATCPVKDQCLEYAIENDEKAGIWGGMSGKARQRLRNQMLANGALRRRCAECGQRYAPTIHQQRLCSDECRAVVRARQQAKYLERYRGREMAGSA